MYIRNTNNKTYKPYAIRAGQTVKSPTVIDFKGSEVPPLTIATPGSTSMMFDSWQSVWPDAADYTDIAKSGLGTSPTWEKKLVCDTMVWESETACFGALQPWIFGRNIPPSATQKGFFQAYHWLADAYPTDASKLF